MPVRRTDDGHVYISPNEKLMELLQSVVENIAIAEEVTDPMEMYASVLSVGIAGILVMDGNQKAMVNELLGAMVESISDQLTAHIAKECDCPEHQH